LQCYTHRDVAAVGICKICGKGLCSSCAREIDRGLACSDACTELAGVNLQMIERAKRVYSIGHKPRIPVTTWFFGVSGSLAIATAVVMWDLPPAGWPLGVIGLLLVTFAVVFWRRYRSLGLSV